MQSNREEELDEFKRQASSVTLQEKLSEVTGMKERLEHEEERQ